jgi:hypothetical protein
MICANFGLVAKATSSGTPTATQRAGSLVQDLGRYNSRSIIACPTGPA